MDSSRLINLLKKAQGSRTLNNFAGQSDVSAGNLSRIMNGQKPSPEILKKLSLKAHNGVTYEELMNAAGYISGSSFTTPVITSFIDSTSNVAITKVPILGRIRAGIPILASENWEGEVNLAENLRADFALRVEGDSMSWAGIYNGDLAFFRQATTAINGDIVAAGAEDGEWYATLKFYIVENGSPVLRAANPNFKDIPITEKHRIIGTLVGIYKEPPSIMDYKKFLISKELSTTGWSEAIEKATMHGLESKQLVQLIELFSHVVKQVK